MEKKKRIPYNATLIADPLKQLIFLAIDKHQRHNDLLEEAILDLLKEYEKKSKE